MTLILRFRHESMPKLSDDSLQKLKVQLKAIVTSNFRILSK